MCDAAAHTGPSTSYTIYHILHIPAPPQSIVVSFFLTSSTSSSSTIIIINTSMTLKEYSGCIKSERLKIRNTQNLDKRGRYPDHDFFPLSSFMSCVSAGGHMSQKMLSSRWFWNFTPRKSVLLHQIIHTILWLNEVSCFFWSKSEIRRLFWQYQISDKYRLCIPYLAKTFVIIQVCLT